MNIGPDGIMFTPILRSALMNTTQPTNMHYFANWGIPGTIDYHCMGVADSVEELLPCIHDLCDELLQKKWQSQTPEQEIMGDDFWTGNYQHADGKRVYFHTEFGSLRYVELLALEMASPEARAMEDLD